MRSFMFKIAVAAAAVALPASANAAITLGSVTPGTPVYSGPTPTYDFETPAPVTGGKVTNTSVSGVSAQPFGSTGSFWTVGPTDGSPGIMDLSAIGDIFSVGFLWGSVDAYNTLEFLDANDVAIATFTGSQIFNPANGDQINPNLNPTVMFNLTGDDITKVAGLRLISTSNAFETDNFAINAVPEPATWALMLLGFGFVGFGMRRRREFASPSFA